MMENDVMKKFPMILALVIFLSANPVWAQSGGHASVGLGHGEEGYLHLEEMVQHMEFSLKMQDASEELKAHGPLSLQHAREALKHYNEALKHGSEALGRPIEMPMADGSGASRREEGSSHSHDEGSH
jgi:hypothetical protein